MSKQVDKTRTTCCAQQCFVQLSFGRSLQTTGPAMLGYVGVTWPPFCKPVLRKQPGRSTWPAIWRVPSLWHSMTLSPLPFDKSWLRPRSCRYFVGVHKGVVLNHISKQNCFQFSKCLFFLKKLHLKSSNSWNSIYYKLNLYRHGTGVVNENKNMFIKSEKTDNQSTSYKTIYYNSL